LLSGGLDSRIVAALSPPDVLAVTLCDGINREVHYARKVASACGIEHRIILRDEDWYPSLMRWGSLYGSAIGNWLECHFLPLGKPEWEFSRDVTTMGSLAGSLVKGETIRWDWLWENGKGHSGPAPAESKVLDMLLNCPSSNKMGVSALCDNFSRECADAYREAATTEVRLLKQWCGNLPDLWELYWNRSAVRSIYFLNAASLRSFTAERNALSTIGIRRFYSTIPCTMRVRNVLTRMSIRLLGARLARIPNANTWLPVSFPLTLHRLSAKCRRVIARTRTWWLAQRRSSDFTTQGSWPRSTRLWLTNGNMRTTMTDLIEDMDLFPSEAFDRDRLLQIWREHLDQKASYEWALGTLSTLGLFMRENNVSID